MRATAESHPLQSAARAKRPRRMGLCSEVADDGENLEDHPALATRYVRRKAPFQHANCPANSSRAALNLFHSVQTKSCLGHCITRGIGLRRQATIFRLRGAVLFSGAEARPAPEFGRARGVEIPEREDFCRAYARRSVFSMESWNFVVPLPFLRRSAGDSMNHKGVEYTLTRSQTPGVLAVAISDRRPGQVGIDRGTACPVGHAPRRAKN